MIIGFKKAFTLAEVLITLGVIGVVAAMTMPTLIGSYQDKVLETQYKRSVSTLANAVTLMMANNDVPGDFSSVPLMSCKRDSICLTEELSKYLPTILKADFDNHYVWMLDELRDMQYKPNPKYEPLAMFVPPAYAAMVPGYWWNRVYLGGTIIATTDGAYYGINTLINDETQRRYNNPNTMLMIMDLNGTRKPNMVGKDFFQLVIDKNGKVIDVTCFSNHSCKDQTLYDKYGEFDIFKD